MGMGGSVIPAAGIPRLRGEFVPHAPRYRRPDMAPFTVALNAGLMVATKLPGHHFVSVGLTALSSRVDSGRGWF